MEILIPDDRIDVQCLVQALTNYVEAKTTHDKARDAYTGYSWGYHGSREINKMDEAACNLGERLDGYIDQRVKAQIAALIADGKLIEP